MAGLTYEVKQKVRSVVQHRKLHTFLIKMSNKRILNISGGLTSAMMVILEYNPDTDFVVFADTMREHPKTYKFLNDFEAYENIPIHRVVYSNQYGKGFTALYTLKKIIPNRQFRTCSVELKIRIATQYARKTLGLKKMDWMIGFRGDEKSRVENYECQKYKTPLFPLYDKQIYLDDVYAYWSMKPYTLEIPRILGNCDLCFLKGKNNIIKIMKHYPHLADKWIADEKRNGKTFIKGISYSQLLQIAMQTKELFPLEDLASAYPQCHCTPY
jgi:hypothetical protein